MNYSLRISLYSFFVFSILSTIATAQVALPPHDNPAERAAYERARLVNPATGTLPANIRTRELAFSTQLPTREQTALHKQSPSSIHVEPWSHRGPSNIGGRTRAFAIDVENEANLIAGGVSGGMWRSIDGGQSWVRTTALNQLANVTCVIQDTRPGKTATWYYGTGEYHGNSAKESGDGIFKSTDNGLTWQPLTSTISGTPHKFDSFDYVWRLATDPLRADVVYAAVCGGIYRSENGGETWTLVLGTDQGTDVRPISTDIVVTSQGVAYATLSAWSMTREPSAVKGIYRSTDGINWTDITPAIFPNGYARVIPAVAPSNEDIVYFLSNRTVSINETGTDLLKYTYLSGDGAGSGGQWDNRSAAIPQPTDFVHGFNSQYSYCMTIKVSPANPDIVSIAGTNIFISTDGFTSSENVHWIGGYNPDYDFSFEDWINQLYPNHHPDVHDIVFLPSNPTVLFTADDGGIHRTDNCFAPVVSWESLNNGYLTTQFYTLAINQAEAGNKTVIGGMQDNNTYGSPHPNSPWRWLAGGDGSYCAIPADNSAYLVSAQYGYLCRTVVDNSFAIDSMEQIKFASTNEGFLFVAPFLLDPNNTDVLYMATTGRVWRNDKIFQTSYKSAWQATTSARTTSPIASVAVSTNPANRLYYGTDRGELFRVDNAQTPLQTATNISGILPPGTISCIAIDPKNADNVIAVLSNYEIPSLFFSNNGGMSWIDISGNLEENPDGSGAGPSCRWAEIIHTTSGPLYLVGTSIGLYSTTAVEGKNTTWVQEGSTSIGNVLVSMIRARQSDGFVAVATHGNGIFTSSVSVATSVGELAIPETLYLEQNYPNPCSRKTTLRFAVPHAMDIRIALYDALGNVVSTPVAGHTAAGYHSSTLETEGLANGRYYLHLQAGGSTQTRIVTVQH